MADPSDEVSSITGVHFVSVNVRVLIGVDEATAVLIHDCLKDAVAEGAVPDLHSWTGADYAEIRTMYLTLAATLGQFRSARRTA